MKKFGVFVFIIVFASCLFPKISFVKAEEVKIEHFFTHELVYDAAKAFSSSNSLRQCFDRDHLTADEFKNILQQLYENDFVLVDIFDVYENVGGKLKVKQNLDFGGKKPFILSFDDMTYDTRGRGIVDKIVEKDGKIYDFCENESVHMTQERDCITILEKFIEDNPSFSINNARAIICVTGYNGMLGYRVFEGTYLSSDRLQRETQELEQVVSCLKQKNYRFASHTYGHINCKRADLGSFKKDVEKWQNQIGKFVGETNIFCYPGGNHISGSANNEILKNKGFSVFLCTWVRDTQKEDEENGATYLYRHPLDGTSLRLCEQEYANFFSTKQAYDKDRSVSFSNKTGR